MVRIAGGHRRLLLLTGDRQSGERRVLDLLTAEKGTGHPAGLLWVAESAPAPIEAVPAGRVARHLGSECRLLVFNAHQGFHPDAFAAAVGTLRGDGDCVLLIPPLQLWAGFDDPDRARFAAYPRSTGSMRGLFIERLRGLWTDSAAVQPVDADQPLHLRFAPSADAEPFELNDAQQAAVAAVEHVVHGHARRPLVLTADRGRGKSTLLGIAAARLLSGGLRRVSVVAPSRNAVVTLFRHATAGTGWGRGRGVPSDVRIGDGELCFRVPAEWDDADAVASDLVVVDEAAAIPVALLERLLKTANRLVFATTVHGYEGSGRGFELRFRASLDRHTPQWRALRLIDPVRWAADDPLEVLLGRTLLLDVELPAIDADDEVSISRLDAEVLAADEPLLRAVFALLVNAHYQTRPSDLRQLLDNPDVRLWVARAGDGVCGVLLGVLEGGFDEEMAGLVLAARRRPRGHLLPQSLAVHAGLGECLRQRVLRVQRIAVHPDRRREGIGGRLLDVAAHWGSGHRIDLLGCAFGVEPGLLGFWQAAGFSAARLGVRVDPASASRSLFMLRGLSGRGQALADRAVRRFQADLPWSLGAGLRAFDSDTALALLRGRDCHDLQLDADDVRDLAGIATGARQPESATALLWKAVVRMAADVGRDDRLAVLLAWQLQHRDAGELRVRFGVEGRAALRGLVTACLDQYLLKRMGES